MSYIPTILISYDELLKHEDKIEAEYQATMSGRKSQKREALHEAYETIREPIRYFQETGFGVITFPTNDLRLVSVSPDLSGRNQDVRNLLDDLGVTYGLD